MTDANDIVITGGARTPVGKFLGGLARVSATDLGTTAAKGALEHAGTAAEEVDYVIVGNVLQSSKDGAYLARHIGLGAGAPMACPAVAMNLACASGLESIVQAGRLVRGGEAKVVLAGGAENMSMMPYAMRGVREGWRMMKTDVDDMLFSALHDPRAGCSIGETVEHLASVKGISREAADAAAVLGQKRTADAQAQGHLAEEIVPVEIRTRRGPKLVEVDENLRPETTAEGLASLPGLFAPNGVVTAGNSTGLNDAAAMVVVTNRAEAEQKGRTPLGRLVSWAAVGVEPKLMGLGPVEASRQALTKAELTLEDMDVIEINDSFTVQSLAVFEELGIDPERVNRQGGAVALGHPMGATGTRLVLSALHQLKREGKRYGLCTVCVGGGQGMAVVVEHTR